MKPWKGQRGNPNAECGVSNADSPRIVFSVRNGNANMKCWLAVSLSVPQDLREAVSNFLTEMGAIGIEEVGEDFERERLKAYFPGETEKKEMFEVVSRYLKSLERVAGKSLHHQIEITRIEEQNWGDNWKKYFKPVAVGRRFMVKPPWSKARVKGGRIPIEIPPGMAFGTGTHASTQLCIQALEETLKRKNLRVLDVGTGSGILAIAAAKLGAREVLGFDIDEDAVMIARENAERNDVKDIVRIRRGGIGKIRGKFELVMANLDFKGLKRLRMPLIHHLKERGSLILSGVLEKERRELTERFLKTGSLDLTTDRQQGEWICLTFKKKKAVVVG